MHAGDGQHPARCTGYRFDLDPLGGRIIFDDRSKVQGMDLRGGGDRTGDVGAPDHVHGVTDQCRSSVGHRFGKRAVEGLRGESPVGIETQQAQVVVMGRPITASDQEETKVRMRDGKTVGSRLDRVRRGDPARLRSSEIKRVNVPVPVLRGLPDG